jgi:hypothetical protein
MDRSSRLWVHEKAQSALILVLLAALVARAGAHHPATLAVGVLAALQAAVLLGLRPRRREWVQKVRLASAYFVGLGLFSVTASVVPALELPLHDGTLAAIDRFCLGETPAVWLIAWARPWLTELMSAFYLAYLLYFHGALCWALLQPVQRARRLFERMFTALALGVAGYLLVPAVGPTKALAGIFSQPLVGGPITAANDWIVHHGSAVYDVFPSLHVFITCVILDHDRQEHPRRFRFMVPVALGLFASTLYLRYHYAIDLVAGAIWFLAFRGAWRLSDARDAKSMAAATT